MKNFLTKKTNILLLLMSMFTLMAIRSNEHPIGGSNGYTGAPGDSVCTVCHSSQGSLTGTVEIMGLPAMVSPNATYPLTVSITDTGGGASRSGFQMVSLKSNNANAGIFSVPASESNVSVIPVGGKSYAGHQPAKNFGASNITTYQVDWTAPSSATGNITLYIGSILANGGNGNSQDNFIANSAITVLSGTGDPLTTSFSNVIDASCSDSADGSARINAMGGSGNYAYEWDNGESNATATMLTGGIHSVTVTDDSNSSVVDEVIIGAPDPIVVTLVSQSDASCNNTNTGTAELNATGGNGGFFYDWGNGITGSVQNSLSAGIYNVTVTDVNNCAQFFDVTIDEPEAIVINISSLVEPSCNGDSDGSVIVDATGGNGGFTYNWLTGGLGNPVNNTITDLPAGSYSVEAFDALGCINEIQFTLGEPDEITSMVSATAVNCLGGQDGTATATGQGGVGGFSYNWSNGSTNQTATDLATGFYNVTISDNNNCSTIGTVEVTEPDTEVTAGINVNTQPNCGNADGILSGFGLGGSGTYTYEWSTGDMGATLSNIPSGNYSITVTDSNGCTSSMEQILEDTDGVSLAANNVVNNVCNGASEGAATISASSTNGTFTYAWSNGGTNETETNLAAGMYTITVTDGNECTGEISIEINEPKAISSLESITHITCNSAEDGSIQVMTSGGTGELSLEWNIGSTEETISDLVPGLYSVVVTDENQCSVEFEYVIEEPVAISIGQTISILPSCPGEMDGSLSIEGLGGTGDLTYSWSNGDSLPMIENLVAADYEVTVTDENDCSFVASYTLDNPSAISITEDVTELTCNGGNDGIISIDIAGGTGDFTILWSTDDTTSTISNLEAGLYSVMVEDENGCIMIDTFELIDAIAISPNISAQNESSNGASDGSATVAPQDGTAPYEYLWSTGDTTQTIQNLAPGVYSVTITDANGCTVDASVVVNNGDCVLTSTTVVNNISCFGLQDGSIAVLIEGAVEPIDYAWSNEQSGSQIEGLEAGTYSLIATDANGCQLQITDLEVTEPSEMEASEPVIVFATSETNADGSISIDVTGGSGMIDVQLITTSGDTLDNLDNLVAGSYEIIATDANGCTVSFGNYTVDILSSTNEVKISATIYPNPARNTILITVEEELTESPTIYSLSGQKVNGEINKSSSTNYSINIDQLNNGLYYIKLVSGNQVELKKVIVNK